MTNIHIKYAHMFVHIIELKEIFLGRCAVRNSLYGSESCGNNSVGIDDDRKY